MSLLEALIALQSKGENDVNGYHFEQTTEGYNGIVYCATNDEQGEKVAVKIARKTARQRAWREYTTTRLLHNLGINNLCPKALELYVDIPELNGELVVSTWLDGKTLVAPPSPEDKDAWLTILKVLAQIHSIKPHMTTIDLPRAAAPAQHPIEMLGFIQQRFDELTEVQFGQFSYAQLKQLLKQLENAVPSYWEEAPELCLTHSDCHPANMLDCGGEIYFVDWENSGWADAALDICNMGSNWRFFHLPENHQDWLRETYAEMRQDASLPHRAKTYAMLSDMLWLIMYSRLYRQREENPTLILRDSPEFQLEMQGKYYTRIHERLDSL